MKDRQLAVPYCERCASQEAECLSCSRSMDQRNNMLANWETALKRIAELERELTEAKEALKHDLDKIGAAYEKEIAELRASHTPNREPAVPSPATVKLFEAAKKAVAELNRWSCSACSSKMYPHVLEEALSAYEQEQRLAKDGK